MFFFFSIFFYWSIPVANLFHLYPFFCSLSSFMFFFFFIDPFQWLIFSTYNPFFFFFLFLFFFFFFSGKNIHRTKYSTLQNTYLQLRQEYTYIHIYFTFDKIKNYTKAPVQKSNLRCKRIMSSRYFVEQPCFVSALATCKDVGIQRNSLICCCWTVSRRRLMSICRRLFSTAVEEWTESTSDLLSLRMDMGIRHSLSENSIDDSI